MNITSIYTGVPSEDELKNCPGIPSRERVKKGAVAVIECVQCIPCNPCVKACMHEAITMGDSMANMPVLDEKKCVGCGECVSKCPGLAITVLDDSRNDGLARLTVPYEYFPLPEENTEVDAVGRTGNKLCKAKVIKVRNAENGIWLVTIEFPDKYVWDVKSIG